MTREADKGLLVGEGLRADGVLIHGPSPLGTLWFPLTGQLTVLYGRNGAGKTTVLRAVDRALRGIALPDCQLSVHLSPVHHFGGFDYRLLGSFRYQEIDETGGYYTLDHVAQAGDDDRLDEKLIEQVQGLQDYIKTVAAKYGLADGLCHTPRLSLVAVGTTDEPRWEPHVSVVPTDLDQFSAAIGFPDAVWEPIRKNGLRIGAGGLPFSLAALRTESGWRELPLPVNVEAMPLTEPDLTEDGMSARDLIACLVGSDGVDVNAETLRRVRDEIEDEEVAGLFESAEADSFEPSDMVSERLSILSDNATLILREFMGTSAVLTADLCHPYEWLDGKVIEWTGTDAYGLKLPITSLGAGSSRWASLAISLALTNVNISLPAVIVMDEPERALHSAAQLQVARSFSQVLENIEVGMIHVAAAIVATHSPAFLSISGANLVHVSRDSDLSIALDPIDTTIGVEGLTAELGISRPDALLTVRWFLFVEGEHDAAIIRVLFGDTLRSRHVHLSTMSGAANVTAHITAQHLLAYSDAKIRVVLDRIGSEATDTWRGAQEAANNSQPSEARRHLEQLGRHARSESTWLYEAGLAALHRNQLNRIEVIGLERPDIINYLPVKSIVPAANTWKELANEFFSTKRSGDFKQWLRQSKGAQFNAQTLAEIASTLTDLADLPRAVDGLD